MCEFRAPTEAMRGSKGFRKVRPVHSFMLVFVEGFEMLADRGPTVLDFGKIQLLLQGLYRSKLHSLGTRGGYSICAQASVLGPCVVTLEACWHSDFPI